MKSNVKMTVETINPQTATELLAINTKNVPLRVNIVNFYAQQMRDGQWQFNGEPIIVSDENVLLDGQHRLEAIVRSKTTQQCVVIRGINSEAFKTIDTGKTRTAADTLALNNVKNSSPISAGVCKFLMLKKGNTISKYSTTSTRIPKQTIYATYMCNSDFFQNLSLSVLRMGSKVKLLNASELFGYMAYLILELNYSEETVFYFFEQLHFHTDTTIKTITTLRDKLLQGATGIFRMSPAFKRECIIKCWNAYVEGKEIKKLASSKNSSKDLDFIPFKPRNDE